MNRKTLGALLCQWHASAGDPVYAVGSYYYAGKRYPDCRVVERAIAQLRSYSERNATILSESLRMFAAVDYGTWSSILSEQRSARTVLASYAAHFQGGETPRQAIALARSERGARTNAVSTLARCAHSA